MKPSVISDIRECFNVCLGKAMHYDADVKFANFKEMFDILEPTLPNERIKYRERIADIYEARRSFVSLEVEEPQRKSPNLFQKNPDICFQHL